MSRLGSHDNDYENGFPRVSGDEPIYCVPPPPCGAFSPRERG